jgi:glycosyltransferase involved in cell wall biosynthesis
MMTGSPFYYFVLTPIFKVFGIKVVLEFRDPWCLRPEVSLKRYKLLRVVESMAIRFADSVIFVNDFVLDFYKKVYPNQRKKFEVIENGYFSLSNSKEESELDFEVNEKVKHFLTKSRTEVVVIFSGKLIYRDITPFFRFLKKKNNVFLLKTGPKEERFCQLVKDYGLEDKILDLGLLSYTDCMFLMKKYGDFNLLITSSYLWEATTKVFDGIQLKVPTLALTPVNSYAHQVLLKTDSGLRSENTAESITSTFRDIMSRDFTFKAHHQYERSCQAEKLELIICNLVELDK